MRLKHLRIFPNKSDKKGLAEIGLEIYSWITDLFPLCRSITGQGVRDTLAYFKKIVPSLKCFSVPSGTEVFDWTVPSEWNILDAWVKDKNGKKIIDFKDNNLHVIGYSQAFRGKVNLAELQQHLHSLPDNPNAVPYLTSYYKKQWGFCLSDKQRKKLKPETYEVLIDSEFYNGNLDYGEILIPGKSKKEIFISSYICHPSMANNELSGPGIAIALSRWIKSLKNPYYSYRIIFIPETIGSLTYLKKNIKTLKKNVSAGFNLTCIGDNRCYSFLPSRSGKTLADKVSLNALNYIDQNFKKYNWLDRGSDERQYCAPGIDLPLVSIMRSKYHEYSEYHSSLDDLSLISPKALQESFVMMQTIIESLENNYYLKAKILGEPHMSKRGLYPSLSNNSIDISVKNIMNVLTYSDGANDLIDISNKIGVPTWKLIDIVNKLLEFDLVKVSREPDPF